MNASVEMRVIAGANALGTIEKANNLTYSQEVNISTVTVTTKCLDDYNFSNIGFIKIDVEGHENSVLRGGPRTIEQNRCPILVECENRHSPGATQELFKLMHSYDYEGFFLLDNRITDIKEFDPTLYQNPSNLADWTDGWKRYGTYINNFIFTPAETFAEYKAACASLLSNN
jgi:hypothetical protein